MPDCPMAFGSMNLGGTVLVHSMNPLLFFSSV